MHRFIPLNTHQKRIERFCPHCNAKLGLRERRRKRHSVEIVCGHCGGVIAGDMIMIGNTKFPKEMIVKRF